MVNNSILEFIFTVIQVLVNKLKNEFKQNSEALGHSNVPALPAYRPFVPHLPQPLVRFYLGPLVRGEALQHRVVAVLEVRHVAERGHAEGHLAIGQVVLQGFGFPDGVLEVLAEDPVDFGWLVIGIFEDLIIASKGIEESFVNLLGAFFQPHLLDDFVDGDAQVGLRCHLVH